MAANVPIYGLDKELAAKAAAKFDPAREAAAKQWIESVVGEQLPSGSFQEALKDGTFLCRAIQKIDPSLIVKYNTSKMPFKQMENINMFLEGMGKLGVPKAETFQTIDLFEGKNMNQVIDSIYSLSRHASSKGYQGPLLGPKLAERHDVAFSDEQLAQGRIVIGLQMGFAGGASQAGMSYGTRRQILDQKIDAGLPDGISQQTQGSFGGANASGITYGSRREIGGNDPGKR